MPNYGVIGMSFWGEGRLSIWDEISNNPNVGLLAVGSPRELVARLSPVSLLVPSDYEFSYNIFPARFCFRIVTIFVLGAFDRNTIDIDHHNMHAEVQACLVK